MTSKLKGKFIHNLTFAFSAQLISLCVSILLSLIAPKILGVREYSYWQLFIFYTNYVNLAQFGIVDGMYLRIGGKEYRSLNFPLIKAQYKCFGLIQLFAFSIIFIFSLFIKDKNKAFVFWGVAIYLVIYNLSRYFGFIFQAANETRLFSISSIIDRLFILILGSIFIFLHIITWKKLVFIFITGITFSLFVSWYWGKEILLSGSIHDKGLIRREMCKNASVGSKLMLSNLASNLILGCGRQAIEWKWGIETFGKISFSLSMTSFFLLFINQVSLVMFPTLRKIDSSKSKEVFEKIEKGFSLISPIIYIVYLPASYLLSLWLPHYSESLRMLMLLLPICVFDGKMQMLYNTYLKVYRKEKFLLAINILCVGLSLLVSTIFASIFSNLYGILIGLLIVIIIRSVISKAALCKMMSTNNYQFIFIDLFFTVFFIVVNTYFNNFSAELIIIAVYFLFLAHYVFTHKKED